MEAKTRILIALPTDGMIHNKTVGTVLAMVLQNTKYELDTYVSAMQGIGEHRNIIVKDFLAGDYDFLLMIDDDNPPPVNILELVELDKEVIGLPTPINMNHIQGINDIRWNVFKDELPIKDAGQGLEEVEMVGTGCILIRRDVLEKIKHPFTTVRNEEDLRTIGTDTAFCKKCNDQGIKIYTHWDYKCRHFKEVDLLTMTY